MSDKGGFVARPVKSRQIPNIQEAIKDAAWKQIAESGAVSLSLRGIARVLKISAPAIYNYFIDRDALISALMYDAYVSFGEYQRAAMAQYSDSGQLLERLFAIGVAYREWALKYPNRYRLIFGSLVPGYRSSEDGLLPVMKLGISALMECVGELHAAGMLRSPDTLTGIPELTGFPGCLDAFTGSADALVTGISMLIWSRVHGMVSLELEGKLPPYEGYSALLFQLELEMIMRQFVILKADK